MKGDRVGDDVGSIDGDEVGGSYEGLDDDGCWVVGLVDGDIEGRGVGWVNGVSPLTSYDVWVDIEAKRWVNGVKAVILLENVEKIDKNAKTVDSRKYIDLCDLASINIEQHVNKIE